MPDYVSFTEAAEEKNCGRNTLYRAADRGKINAQEVAGRRLVVDDDTFRDYQPRMVGRRAARQKEEAQG